MKIAGLPVIDAPKSVIITISNTDVKKGHTKDPGGCAAALACKRQMKAEDARIHIGRSYIKINKKWFRYRTSAALRNEIISFDRGGTFAPGDYLLKTIPRKDEGIKKTKPAGKKDNRVKITKRLYHVVTGVREKGANR